MIYSTLGCNIDHKDTNGFKVLVLALHTSGW
jgi:hypothetical protein